MGKALYRKYRSKSLSEIVGQEHITDVLENSLKSGKISHAYLFTGPRGTGKTSVARILAHAVNDFPYELEDDYLDIVEIDAASNTGVDNIRDLRDRAAIAPTKGKYKIYIIDEVHMLSKSAFNALLKTLEEPPAHVVFIMATTDAHKVPITIVSRSQQFVFRLADPATMKNHLRRVANAEAIKITDGALAIIAKRGGGSFRDSISLLDQISTLTENEITSEIINSALGLPSDQLAVNLLTAYAQNNTQEILDSLKHLASTGIKPDLIAEELLHAIIENPTPTLLPLLDSLTSVPRSPFPEAKLLLALLPKPAITFSNNPKPATSFLNDSLPPRTTTYIPDGTDGFAQSAVPSDSQRMTSSAEVGSEEKTVAGSTQNDVAQSSFSWDTLIDTVHEKSLPLHAHLSRLEYSLSDDTLTIYTKNRFTMNILEKPSNKSLLTENLGDLSLRLVPEPKPAEDSALAQISDILGGTVQEVQIDTNIF
jgi:DNA polymerase-3 subunit gamma/tau